MSNKEKPCSGSWDYNGDYFRCQCGTSNQSGKCERESRNSALAASIKAALQRYPASREIEVSFTREQLQLVVDLLAAKSSESEKQALQPIRGAGIEGGYVIVTPVGVGPEPARRLHEQILALFPVEKRT